MAAVQTEQGLETTWDLILQAPTMSGKGVAQRVAIGTGSSEWCLGLSAACMSWGQISVKVPEQQTQNQLRPIPTDGVASLVPTYRATALCAMELGRPNLACPSHA